MAALKERIAAWVDRVRTRYPAVDHLVRTAQHYGNVNGNGLAGAVTFFGFLSFFPILALAFFSVGQLSKVYDARGDLVGAIDSFLPGIVGSGAGEIPLRTFEENAATIGLIGLAGVLYAGLGWLSGMRDALEVVFAMPKRDQPNFVVGKLRDLLSLTVIGLVLLVSVGLSGLLSGFSESVLDLVGLENTPVTAVLLWIVVHGLGIAATTLLFLAMFKLLVDPGVPRRAMLSGAILGGIGFEVLKSLSVFLIASTKSQPAFQAFGIALILVVWINYFSRVVILSAAYAYTSPLAVEARSREAMRAPGAAFHHAEQNLLTPPTASPQPASETVNREPPDDRPAGSHRAAPAERSRHVTGAAVAALAVAGGAAVLAWRRSTR